MPRMEGSHHVNCNSIMFRKRTVKKTEIDRLFLAAKSFNTNLVHFLPGGGRSSIKYVRPDFVSLDPLPPVCALTLLPSPFPLLLFPPSPLPPFPPSTSLLILYIKEDMTDIFCEFLSIKELQTTLQNKETTIQSYWKMSN